MSDSLGKLLLIKRRPTGICSSAFLKTLIDGVENDVGAFLLPQDTRVATRAENETHGVAGLIGEGGKISG